MAIIYCWSGAAGSGSGADWTNAKTTLTLAFAIELAGDTIYVAHDHSESTGALVTLTSGGTNVLPTKIICVDRAGTVPPVSADRRTTAQVTTTGSFGINFNGTAHFDGIIFNSGTGVGSASIGVQTSPSPWLRFDNCSLRINATATTSRIVIANAGSAASTLVEWNNTTVSFGNVAQALEVSGLFKWSNTSAAIIGTAPTNLFVPPGSRGAIVEVVGVDLSAMGSGKTVVGAPASATIAHIYRFVDCKLDAAVTKAAAVANVGNCEIDFLRSSATGNYAVSRHRATGTQEHETIIVRTGGSSDGTTPISWKTTTTASCNYSMPFECSSIAIWNDTVGSPVTATVEATYGAVPNDDEVWLDLEYLSDASSPMGGFVNDGKANLLTASAAQTSSLATWGGGSSNVSLDGTPTAGVVMSNGNLTAVHGTTNANMGVSSTSFSGAGKYYFEFTLQAWGTASTRIGIIKIGGTYSEIAGTNNVVVALGSGSSNISANGALTGYTLGAAAAGNVFGVAVDLNARLLWMNKNNGLWNGNASANPVTGVNGVSIPSGDWAPHLHFGGATAASAADQLTANFGQTAYTYTAPAGFGNWSIGSAPFKLSTTFTPQQKGWVYGRVKCAKESSIVYIDPMITLS